MSGEIIKMTDRMTMMFEAEDSRGVARHGQCRYDFFKRPMSAGSPSWQVWCEALWKSPGRSTETSHGVVWVAVPPYYFLGSSARPLVRSRSTSRCELPSKLLSCFCASVKSRRLLARTSRNGRRLVLMAVLGVGSRGRQRRPQVRRQPPWLLSGDASEIDNLDEQEGF